MYPKAETEELTEKFSWKYAWRDMGTHKQKVSVSELKHRAMEERSEEAEQTLNTAEPLFPQEIPTPYLPRFVQEASENAGALYGTMVHRFLECLDFAALPEFVSEKQGAALCENPDRSSVYAGTDDGSRRQTVELETASELFAKPIQQNGCEARRRPVCWNGKNRLLCQFRHSLSGKRANQRKKCLYRGIIDVFWEEEDGIVLLDYKTDRVDNAEELIRRYKKQLELYADALNRFGAGKTVKEILIYSFALAEEIVIQ